MKNILLLLLTVLVFNSCIKVNIRTFYDKEENYLKEDYSVVKGSDIKNGKYEMFDITGSIIKSGRYRNGLKTGLWNEFVGEFKVSSISYKKGVKNGKFVYYNANGTPYIKGWNRDGKQEGRGYIYTISGDLKYKEFYKNDSLISREKVILD